MAFEYVGYVLRGAFALDPSAKLILVILAEHARRDSGGIAWPSVPTISRLACISERQTQVHLHKLVKDGWLTVARPSSGGTGRTVHYRINVKKLQAVMKDGEAGNTDNGEADNTDNRKRTVKRTTLNGEVEPSGTVTPASPEQEVAVINKPGLHLPPAASSSNAVNNGPDRKTGSSSNVGGTCLPPGWTLPDEWKAWALSFRQDWNDRRCIRESRFFRDYWHTKAGMEARKANWAAVWRDWVRRAH